MVKIERDVQDYLHLKWHVELRGLAISALECMVNGKNVRGRRRYQMIDNIMINGLYDNTKRKAEKSVEWRRV